MWKAMQMKRCAVMEEGERKRALLSHKRRGLFSHRRARAPPRLVLAEVRHRVVALPRRHLRDNVREILEALPHDLRVDV